MASNLIAAQYAVSLPIATIKAAAVWLIESYAEAAVAPAPEAAPLDQRDRALTSRREHIACSPLEYPPAFPPARIARKCCNSPRA